MNLSSAELLASLPEAQQRIALNLTDEQFEELQWDWLFWARPSQKPPGGDWLTWLILAGRGFGKTRTGAETLRDWACGTTPLAGGCYSRFLLVAETAADARDVMVEGESGILAVHPPDFRPTYEPSKRRLTWPNGATASLFNATEPDQLRGPQGDAAWCDELAKWQYARETWDMLQFALRLGERPRQIVTTTPRPVPVIKELLAAKTTVVTRGATIENRKNLAPTFLKQITERYSGTRLGRQELEAEILDDNPNALWTRDMVERSLVKDHPPLLRTVVAVDPSGTAGNDEGDDIGIVAAGIGADGKMYVLTDATLQASPAEWGKVAVKLYKDLGADRIVGERNFGGAMVAHVVRTVDGSVAYKEVTASRGKWLRAEPVAALYEQGRVKHVGGLAKLEDEMCSFGPDGKSDGKSPNRLDALVWAATELMLGDGANVFESAEEDFVVAPIDIPRHWRRVFALEVTHSRVACLWGALEQGSDTVYVCSEYVAKRADLAVHAAAIRDRGEWVPGVINPLARGRTQEQGSRIIERLLAMKLDIFEAETDQGEAIEEMQTRLAGKRLKVFNTLPEWLREYRNYRRDKEGTVVEENDALMVATGMLCLAGLHIATTDTALEAEAQEEWSAASRSSVTGY